LLDAPGSEEVGHLEETSEMAKDFVWTIAEWNFASYWY
jgi:hypothetical protein